GDLSAATGDEPPGRGAPPARTGEVAGRDGDATGNAERSAPKAERPGGDAKRPRAEAEALEMDYSVPTRVVIPRLGVSSTLEDLGLAPDGTMEVPVDPDKAGWFRPSVPPGVVGASVIAGHVTWDQQPVVFFRLGDLRPGDTIKVRREDGSTAIFTVRRVAQFPKSSFPTDAVYDQPPRPELRLITCGGTYDEDENRYLDNVIVWASLTRTHPAPV
ncbi:MAG: class F sortase, partial [Actinomycetota bacterium]|nr:class F sortase [Actinomycetota bacterium]